MKKILLLISIVAMSSAWSLASLSYIVNGGTALKATYMKLGGSGKLINALPAYSKFITNNLDLNTYNAVIIGSGGFDARLSILSETNALSGRNGLYITSNTDNVLAGRRMYQCYFYNGNPVFTLSYMGYISLGKTYYDYNFSYIQDANNDIISVDSEIVDGSISAASVACNKMDDDMKHYLGEFKTKTKKKHKGAK